MGIIFHPAKANRLSPHDNTYNFRANTPNSSDNTPNSSDNTPNSSAKCAPSPYGWKPF